MKNARIILVEGEKKPTPMKETADIKEDELQFLLENNPGLLPGDQINPDAPRRWLLAARELGVPGSGEETGRWSLDQLILDQNSEEASAVLLAHKGGLSETARDLAYRLYSVCERKGWAQDAPAYNMLVVAWPRLKALAARHDRKQDHLL